MQPSSTRGTSSSVGGTAFGEAATLGPGRSSSTKSMLSIALHASAPSYGCLTRIEWSSLSGASGRRGAGSVARALERGGGLVGRVERLGSGGDGHAHVRLQEGRLGCSGDATLETWSCMQRWAASASEAATSATAAPKEGSRSTHGNSAHRDGEWWRAGEAHASLGMAFPIPKRVSLPPSLSQLQRGTSRNPCRPAMSCQASGAGAGVGGDVGDAGN